MSVENLPDQISEKREFINEDETERTKEITDADHAEVYLRGKLKSINPFSETFIIKPDGTFDEIRADGKITYFGVVIKTPAELKQIAREVEEKYPEYEINFDPDPDGKWLRYTASKSEK